MSEKIDSAKLYWLRHLPIAELSDIASVIVESYRNDLITEKEAITAMGKVEGEIKNWIKYNNKFKLEIEKTT